MLVKRVFFNIFGKGKNLHFWSHGVVSCRWLVYLHGSCYTRMKTVIDLLCRLNHLVTVFDVTTGARKGTPSEPIRDAHQVIAPENNKKLNFFKKLNKLKNSKSSDGHVISLLGRIAEWLTGRRGWTGPSGYCAVGERGAIMIIRTHAALSTHSAGHESEKKQKLCVCDTS